MNNKQPKTLAGINWSVRVKNPQFWFQIFLAVMAPVMAYTGLTAGDFSSWGIVYQTGLEALSNPYMLSLIVVSVYNAIGDPTTRGIADSAQAKGYSSPASNK